MEPTKAGELRNRVISQLAQPSNVIDGEDKAAGDGQVFSDLCPATGRLIAEVPESGASDVDAAVESARQAQEEWAAMDGAERGRLMFRFADAIEAQQERLSLLESTDNGRPRRETGSQAAIVAKWFRYYGGITDKLQGSTIPVSGPYLNYTRRVPVGVCAAITPWNHPMLIATKKIAPAIACGNSIVVKPSEMAPLSVIEMARIAVEAGIPPGVLNVVAGGRAPGEALALHEGIDRIDVTGSTPTGIAVARSAAGTLKRVGMELGGKAANVVFDADDLDRLVRGLVFSAYVGQGQTCVAGSRVLVHEDMVEEISGRLAEAISSIKLGDPLAGDTQMGPVISPAAAERIRKMMADAKVDGAEILTGGEGYPQGLDGDLSADGFVDPTLMLVPDASARIANDEVFGPVMTVTPFRDEAEAIEIANSVPFGLGSAVWTSDVSRAHRIASKLRVGVVWINDYHRIDPASPWGGFKLSGYGRENGWAAVEEFTAPQSVWVPLEQHPMDWYEHSGTARLN